VELRFFMNHISGLLALGLMAGLAAQTPAAAAQTAPVHSLVNNLQTTSVPKAPTKTPTALAARLRAAALAKGRSL
jgi:hypothetical protein